MDAKAKSKKWGVWAPTPLSNNTTIHLCSLVRNVKAKNSEIKNSIKAGGSTATKMWTG